MAITSQQKAALEEIIQAVLTATPPKRSRHLADMFLELVDRTDWAHYYEVRSPGYVCFNNV
jgi:chromatin structure-remodeling complex subunit RSC1/2